MGNLNFDASQVAPRTAFDPLPPGWYVMRIIGAEMVPSESAGEMLKLQHEIDEGVHPEHNGRRVFSHLCINHPTSDIARDIANRTLSALCHSVGKLQVSDSEELLGVTMRVKLKVKPADKERGYDASNEVSGYKSVKDEVEGAPAPAANTPRTATAASGNGAPAAAAKPPAQPAWKR